MRLQDRYLRHEFWFDYFRWGLAAQGVRREDTDPDDPGPKGEFDGLTQRLGAGLRVATAVEAGWARVDIRSYADAAQFPQGDYPSSCLVMAIPTKELRIEDHSQLTQGTIFTPAERCLVQVESLHTVDGSAPYWNVGEEHYRVSLAPAEGSEPWVTRNPTQAMYAGLSPAAAMPRPAAWVRPGWEHHDVDGPLPF